VISRPSPRDGRTSARFGCKCQVCLHSFFLGLRLLLTDCRKIVIANADHTITQGFASLIEDELHEWKFQLGMRGAMLQFILFSKHLFTSGELHLNVDYATVAASLQYNGLPITRVRCTSGIPGRCPETYIIARDLPGSRSKRPVQWQISFEKRTRARLFICLRLPQLQKLW
jgi:hypothetical protein